MSKPGSTFENGQNDSNIKSYAGLLLLLLLLWLLLLLFLLLLTLSL